MKPLKTCKVFEGLVRRCFEIPNRGNPKLIYYTTEVHYKTNLTKEIQRDKSRDSSARGITYILEEQSGKEVNGSMYNGGGLGLKGSSACRRSSAGSEGILRLRRVFEAFEETSRGSKGHRGVRRKSRGSKEVEGFEGSRATSREVSRASKGCPMTGTPQPSIFPLCLRVPASFEINPPVG